MDDDWGPGTSNLVRRSEGRPTTTRFPVVDDWEDDDDGEDSGDAEPSKESNQKIWDEANARAAAPMPDLIITSASTGSVASPLPPPAAFEPKMKILKRPKDGTTKTNETNKATVTENLKDKEERYRAARERIFGDKTSTSPSSSTSTILRQPKGPPNVSS